MCTNTQSKLGIRTDLSKFLSVRTYVLLEGLDLLVYGVLVGEHLSELIKHVLKALHHASLEFS